MYQHQVTQCPFCGSTELAEGVQSGYATMSRVGSLFAGSTIFYIVCTDCGSILHSYLKNPECFKSKEQKAAKKKRVKAERYEAEDPWNKKD